MPAKLATKPVAARQTSVVYPSIKLSSATKSFNADEEAGFSCHAKPLSSEATPISARPSTVDLTI